MYKNILFVNLLIILSLGIVPSCQKDEEAFDKKTCDDDDGDYTNAQWYITGADNGVGREVQPLDFSVNVAIVSDGLDSRHCDLTDQIDHQYNYNYYNKTKIPTLEGNMSRGTVMAGLIAAEDNTFGITGVAPSSKIVFFNLLNNRNFVNEANAMGRNAGNYDISLNTWASIPGKTGFVPSVLKNIKSWEHAVNCQLGHYAKDLKTCNTNDRGVVYIFSAGEKSLDKITSLRESRDSNLNAYANFHGVMAVCSITSDGVAADYSVTGSNLWVCGPSAGKKKIVTTDVLGEGGYNNSDDNINHDYTGVGTESKEAFYGGDVSAALVAGVAALVRSKESTTNRAELSWRDVRIILAESAKKIDPSDDSWQETGAMKISDNTKKYEHSEKYGFGLVSAKDALILAQNWAHLSPHYYKTVAVTAEFEEDMPDSIVTIGADQVGAENLETPDPSKTVAKIENIIINIYSEAEGDLDGAIIELTAPDGKVSTLIPEDVAKELLDKDIHFPTEWRFSTVRHLGINPIGDWKLTIKKASFGNKPKAKRWTIRFWGRTS
ncbi:MAG: S8 family serine peptidase [SAR324 cluster bacterium]|nr:S8 family serine peptidase [SAR324 cluster bacterium]